VQKGREVHRRRHRGGRFLFCFRRYGRRRSQDDLFGPTARRLCLPLTTTSSFVNILPADRPGEKALSASRFRRVLPAQQSIITTPRARDASFFVNREPGSDSLTLWGNMPLDDAGANEALAIEDPAEFAAGLFRRCSRNAHCDLRISVRAHRTGRAFQFQRDRHRAIAWSSDGQRVPGSPIRPITLASYESKPLLQDIRVINKVSQNCTPELLLRLLGASAATPGRSKAGLEVLRGIFDAGRDLERPVRFLRRIGTSRQNLVAPHAIVQLLRYCSTQPWGADYKATFPIAASMVADRTPRVAAAAQSHMAKPARGRG